jgi:CopA family copper-resistance protein
MLKKIFLIAIIFCSPVFAFAQHDMKNMSVKDASKQECKQPAKPVNYTCLMHLEIQSAKPGNCPKCGMKLIKQKAKTSMPETIPETRMKMDMPMPKDAANHQQNTQDMQKGKKPKLKVEIIKTIENKESPKTIRYDLYVADTVVNFTGKTKHAIAVNGSIPMPTLTFTEGDTAEIYVHNMMNTETSLHWHGLFLPNQYDGVPNLTQMPIKAHTTHLYKFPIIQHGTHWYHSHTGLQEQIGMYGAIILNKRKELDIPTIPIVLSEWTDMKPEEVHRSLHNASDWFAIEKGTTQSYGEAIKSGYLKTKLTNEWKRMNAMDVSDVYYNKFLINGKIFVEQPQFKAGDKVRLRIANGSSSTYFWLTYSGGKITVIANDGNDVETVEVDRLIIAVAETYDVIITLHENMSYEFLVTPEDRTNNASLWLGSGMKMPATPLPKLKYFAGMKMMNSMMAINGDLIPMKGMQMSNQTMDMNMVMYPEITGEESKGKMKMNTLSKKADINSMPGMIMDSENSGMITLNYGMLKSTEKTTLHEGPVKELKFELTGNMNRYVWSIDNKVVSEADNILIRKGENVRIILYNNTMMRHPMHIHGHDFRVLNGQGENAPLKNVLDIMPMERDTLEFAATESGDWFFHCHILYHMMSGMGRVFSYENSPANPEIPDPKLARHNFFWDDRHPHFMARVGLESNGSDGVAMFAQTRWKISTLWHLGYHNTHGYESETMLGRYMGKMQWLYPYVGFDYHYKIEGGPKNIFGSEKYNWLGQLSNKNNRKTIVAGVAYTLPMLVIADARVDGTGKFRFQLSREDISITPRLRFNWMINTDKEYMAGFRYITTKYISLTTHYDSDMGLGAGITLTY